MALPGPLQSAAEAKRRAADPALHLTTSVKDSLRFWPVFQCESYPFFGRPLFRRGQTIATPGKNLRQSRSGDLLSARTASLPKIV